MLVFVGFFDIYFVCDFEDVDDLDCYVVEYVVKFVNCMYGNVI